MSTTKERLKALVDAAMAVAEDKEAAKFVAEGVDALLEYERRAVSSASDVQSVAIAAFSRCLLNHALELRAEKPSGTERYLKLVSP